jgi:4-amino-4-deoxy-L-arabinose transferase-like glycosyltransferase
MNNIFILGGIFVANLIAILAVYFSISKNTESKTRLVNTMIGIGVAYIVTRIAFALSTIGLHLENVTQASKDYLVFAFVPVNALLVEPFIIRSYYKAKEKELSQEKFSKRVIAVAIIVVCLVIGEIVAFRNMQENIMNSYNELVRASEENKTEEDTNTITNEILNEVATNTTVVNAKAISNSVANTTTTNVVNDVVSNTTNETVIVEYKTIH